MKADELGRWVLGCWCGGKDKEEGEESGEGKRKKSKRAKRKGREQILHSQRATVLKGHGVRVECERWMRVKRDGWIEPNTTLTKHARKKISRGLIAHARRKKSVT